MSQIPHSPGPWFVADHDDFVVAAGNGFSICDCAPGNPYDVTDAQGVANARLIAAAPELLDALKKAVENIKVWHNMGGNEGVWDIYWHNAPEMKPIRDVIAKAEGRT